jgi:hypothetical protein
VSLLAGLLAWTTLDPESPARGAAEPTAEIMARGLVLEDLGPEGEVLRVEIGQLRREKGRLGMLWTPLLDHVELRDVRISVGDGPVEEVGRLKLGGLWHGRRVPERLRSGPLGARLRQLTELVGHAQALAAGDHRR